MELFYKASGFMKKAPFNLRKKSPLKRWIRLSIFEVSEESNGFLVSLCFPAVDRKRSWLKGD